ncbi:MAG TPA: RsmE family RNA methyltransferase [Gemmatimonadales bacterium]|nr:RsmE family RNA methyltransferase [Gemmatimonadales bacterium]
MIRVLIERDGSLREGEGHHLQVRRVEPGEVVELRDGEGLVGRGTLRRTGRTWSVEVGATEHVAPPSPLVLAVGAGDRERFGWAVEKAAELGVTTVIPLECERTAGVATRVRPQNLDRLRRHALEVVKQSGAAWATRVDEPISLEALLGQPADGARWLADASGGPTPAVLGDARLTVVVGPEGGLTPDERERVLRAGFEAVRLAAHTLRFETAAVAAAAAAVAARLRGSNG